jgi:hypothetical protein
MGLPVRPCCVYTARSSAPHDRNVNKNADAAAGETMDIKAKTRAFVTLAGTAPWLAAA